MQPPASEAAYHERRKHLIYLHAARSMCFRVAPAPASVIDVGSHHSPTLEWYRGIAPRLVSLDHKRPYEADGVESIRADFLDYRPEARFDLAICLQVLEHVPDARAFAQKLLAVARMVVISVPYRWPAGTRKDHLHDPVDRDKLYQWFGRKPQRSYIAREIRRSAGRRLIQAYDTSRNVLRNPPPPWYERTWRGLERALRAKGRARS